MSCCLHAVCRFTNSVLCGNLQGQPVIETSVSVVFFLLMYSWFSMVAAGEDDGPVKISYLLSYCSNAYSVNNTSNY